MRQTLIFFALLSLAWAQQPYDLLIKGGRVVDGTGNPSLLADVAIRDRKIVAIGTIPAAQARRVIDASGLIVSPGFVDIHNHSDYTLLQDGNAESML